MTYELNREGSYMAGCSSEQPELEEVIVTRHPGLVQYIHQKYMTVKGRETPVITHATWEQVSGKRVFGVLPLSLAAAAAEVVEIEMNIPAELRGKELTIDEMMPYVGKTYRYKVQAKLW